MTEMLSQINQLLASNIAFVSSWLIHIHCKKLITYFRSEFTVVNLTKLSLVLISNFSKQFQFFLEPLFVVKLTVEFTTLVFRSFLPSKHVKALFIHQYELRHNFVILLIYKLTAVTQVQTKYLVD